jgi:hypothetical protein
MLPLPWRRTLTAPVPHCGITATDDESRVCGMDAQLFRVLNLRLDGIVAEVGAHADHRRDAEHCTPEARARGLTASIRFSPGGGGAADHAIPAQGLPDFLHGEHVRQGVSAGGLFVSMLRTDPLFGYGTERMRQKLFVAALGVLVSTSTPTESARLVVCGTQLTGARLNVRSSA